MKTLIIDAIIGAGFPTLTLALTAEKAGLAEFINTGMFNTEHRWIRASLEQESIDKLKMIYEGLRASREAPPETGPAPVSEPPSASIIQFSGRVH